MNKSIIVAVLSVSMMVVARIIMAALVLLNGHFPLPVLLPIVVAILILIGIVKGQRLAWQWGRLLGLVGAIILTLSAVGAAMRIPENPTLVIGTILLAMQGIPLFPLFFVLGTKEAKEHFRVICPQCGKSRVKGGNFLFTKVLCRVCGAEWS